jgi:competence transcription factor ComK
MPKGVKKGRKGQDKGYATYLHKLLKQVSSVDKKITISKQGMEVVNALLESVENRVSNRAFQLVKFQKKQTLAAPHMQVATKNVFPPEMGGQAISQASAALHRFAQAV